jgi:hypothetical protein
MTYFPIISSQLYRHLLYLLGCKVWTISFFKFFSLSLDYYQQQLKEQVLMKVNGVFRLADGSSSFLAMAKMDQKSCRGKKRFGISGHSKHWFLHYLESGKGEVREAYGNIISNNVVYDYGNARAPRFCSFVSTF